MLLACVWGEMWSLNWTMTRVTNGGLIKDDGAVRLEVGSVLPTDPPSCLTCDNILPVPSSLSLTRPTGDPLTPCLPLTYSMNVPYVS